MSRIPGLQTFFKSFFKTNTGLVDLLLTALPKRNPGQRLWQNNDIRIDLGETLEDGAVNIVWQRQSQTKNPALKKITDTHTKIVTQKLDPKNPPTDAQFRDDVFDKL